MDWFVFSVGLLGPLVLLVRLGGGLNLVLFGLSGVGWLNLVLFGFGSVLLHNTFAFGGLGKFININSSFSLNQADILVFVSQTFGINHCDEWKVQESHIQTNTRRLQMSGIMMQAVCLHHFWFEI